MTDHLSRVIVVTEGATPLHLHTYDDIRAFLTRAKNAPSGIVRVLNMARSQDQKELAVLAFSEWARLDGRLVQLQPA